MTGEIVYSRPLSNRARAWIALPAGWGLSAAPTAFLVIFFLIPSALLLLVSFYQGRSFQIIPEFTWANYARTLGAAGFWKVTWIGMQNGLLTATASLILSFPLAWYMAYKARSNVLLYIVLLSWFTSYLVRIYAWRLILGTNGVINSMLMKAGLISEPVSWLVFSPFATVITLVHIMVPFTLLILVSALRDVKQDYLDAARDLGASRARLLTSVVLPMAHKGIVGSFMFTFILSAGDFITPQLLGGSEGVTTGLLIANQFRSSGNWPLGASMAFILMASFAVVYVTLLVTLWLLRLSPGRRYHE